MSLYCTVCRQALLIVTVVYSYFHCPQVAKNKVYRFKDYMLTNKHQSKVMIRSSYLDMLTT